MPRRIKAKIKNAPITSISLFTKYKLYIIIAVVVCVVVLGLTLGLYFGLKNGDSDSGSNPPNPPNPPKPLPTVSPYIPGKPVSIDEWGGWATTTADSESATPIFPSGIPAIPNIDLAKISNNGNGNKIGSIYIKSSGETIDVIGTMGMAIPWAVYASIFGFKTRLDFLNAVIDSCAGKNNMSCCAIVQPINRFPDEIAPPTLDATNSSFPMIDKLCSSNCMDINNPDITATYNNGTKYPAYLLVPFMGCGGDCNHNSPGPADCFNGCSNIQKVAANFNYFTECAGVSPDNSCKQIKWMSDNGWVMNSNIENNFINNSDIMFAISNKTDNGRNLDAANGLPTCLDGFTPTPTCPAGKDNLNKGRINYCSGKNMHFDVERYDPTRDNQNPYWHDLPPGDLDNSISLPSSSNNKHRGGSIMNTIVRYALVPGNIFGNFNVLADGTAKPIYPAPTPACPSSKGGSSRCGINYNDAALCKTTTCSTNDDCPASHPKLTCYADVPC